MVSLHNINSIAKYERKTLFRSWFFRIFSILSLVVLFVMNLGMVTEVGDATWMFRAVPSTIPYFNLLILNVAQAIIAVFLASDFLKRDKKLDTTEVIYMRSMTNGEYVIGKTMGNIQVFMILNFAVLLMAMIFNFIAPDTQIPWLSYLLYLVLISIPTLVFIMGLSFLLMSLIRNQAVTFVIILGYIGVTLFLVKASYYYVFDYMAFNIPMLESQVVGLGNLDLILGHRGIYFFLGAGFIFLTIFLLKRLPQSEGTTWASVVLSAIFISAGVFLAFNHVNRFVVRDRIRAEALVLNDQYARKPAADVTRHEISLEHKGSTLVSQSAIDLKNLNAVKIDTLVLSLNPGLQVKSAQLNGQSVQLIRKEQLILIPVPGSMAPGQSATIGLEYEGNIDESFCYLDIDNKKQNEKYGDFVINVDKRYAFLTPEYVLLTPEANWYPTSGTTYSPKFFGWNKVSFTDFKLKVKTDAGLQAVSQGEISSPEPGRFEFKNENPLSMISLSIGKYVQKKMKAGKVEFGIWHIEGHDFFSKALPEISDTIPSLIEERLRDFERTYNLSYPFKRFYLVETPAQFKSYERTWTFQQETVQPEMVYIQEKGYRIRDVDVKMSIKREKRWTQHDGQSLTDKEYQIRAINNIIGNFIREGGRANFNRQAGGQVQITETVNPYFVFSQLYHFSNHLRSEHWPVIDLVLEAYYKSQSNDMRSQWMREMSGLSEDEMANIALQDYSFEELLGNKDQEKIIDNLVKLKGDYLFTMIQAKSGDKDFTAFMRKLLQETRFRVLTFDSLDNRLTSEFGVAITPFMDNWFKNKKLAGFLISPVTAVNTKSEDQIRTMVSFSASNTSDADGVVKLIFRLGGFGGGRGRMMRGAPSANDNITKILLLKAGETKKVSYLFDSEPRGLTINTLTSKNIPQTLASFFGKVEEDLKAIPKDGEELTDVKVSDLQPNEIVVDNEDAQFTHTLNNKTSLLYKLVTKEKETGLKYSGFDNWRPAIKWTNTTNSAFYGLYVRSAYYIKSGSGDQKATWELPVKEAGSYDIFTYVNPSFGRRGGFGPGGGGGGGNNNEDNGEFHYFITHDDGVTEQTLQIQNANAGWNELGSFYLSPGKAKIVLTNKSTRRVVVADAIKIVKN